MAERETEQIEAGTESRNVVDNKSTAEHTPEHKQNKDRAAYSDAIDIGLDEDDGETLGRTSKNTSQKHRFQIESASPLVNNQDISQPVKSQPETVQMAVVKEPKVEVPHKQEEPQDQIATMLQERIKEAQKQSSVLYIPNFSDVGRINEMEEEEILQEVQEEMEEEMREKQIQLHDMKTDRHDSNINSKMDKKVEAEPIRTVQSPVRQPDFTPRASSITNQLLQKTSPQKQIEPQKEKPCCSLF